MSLAHPSPSADRTSPHPAAGGYVAFALVVAGLATLVVWRIAPGVLHGGLLEPDNYMRLVRVRHLVEGGHWYDGTIPRSNAPYGEVLHWTRPLDVILLAGAAVFLPFTSFNSALHLAAIVVPPLLLLLTCYALAWAITPLTGSEARFYAMIALLAQPGVVGNGLPGRPDHHILLLLLFVLAFGFTVRWLARPRSRAPAVGAGLVAGVGVWVGPEFLLPLALMLSAGAALWVVRGGDAVRPNVGLSAGSLAALTLGLVLEHPLAGWLHAEYDRISAPHVLVGILALAYWLAASGVQARTAALARWTGRALFALVGGGAALVVLHLVYPLFFEGPTVAIDPRLWPIWFDRIEERAALLSLPGMPGAGNLLIYLGPVAFCLPFLFWVLKREGDPGRAWAWGYTAFALAVLGGLSLFRIRFVGYPEVLSAGVTAAILARVLPRLDPMRPHLARTLARAAVSGAMITGMLFLGFALTALAGQTAGERRGAAASAEAACPLSRMAGLLAHPSDVDGPPRTVLAHVDYGPELLYRTPDRVVGTPYHRNADGILAVFRALGGSDLSESRRIIDRRGVDLVLVCPLNASIYGASSQGRGSKPSLHDRLVAGDAPAWLTEVPTPRGVAGDFKLFAVEGRADPGG